MWRILRPETVLSNLLVAMLRAVSIAALLWTARFSAFELKIDVDNRTLTMPFFEDDDLIMAAVTLKDFTGLELVGAGCKPSKYSDCLLRRLVSVSEQLVHSSCLGPRR